MKSEMRCSPDVRMTRSGSAWPRVQRCSPNLVGSECLGEGVKSAALCLMRFDDAAHGGGDFAASAVADSEVHVQTGVASGAFLCGGERACKLGVEAVARSNVLHTPIGISCKFGGEFADNPKQVLELVAATRAKIVGGEQVQRDNLHSRCLAPPEKLGNLPGAGAMTEGCSLLEPLLRPTPVSVNNDRDVMRNLCLDNFTPQPPLVQTVQQAGARRRGQGTHLGSLAICVR